MRNVLVISPNFPPTNAADMHRIRQSLMYFQQFGWKATVIAVEPEFVEMGTDPMLLKTIPNESKIIRIKAFKPEQTRKFGLGNLGYRSLLQFYKTGTSLLKKNRFDLIYFTTTAFPVMILGRIWKRKFKIPFILDMQDPWRNDFYLDKPKNEQPPKFWLAYRMDKYLERFAMKKVDGIISVSDGYPKMLMERYPNIKPDKCIVIPFGGASIDFDVLEDKDLKNRIFSKNDGNIHCVYIGRGGYDMNLALSGIFKALAIGLQQNKASFEKIKMHFVGTSYAADGKGIKTILPVAEKFGVESMVNEITNRLPYFEAMKSLTEADILIVPGSTDTNYTASKLYPYIMAKRPLIAVFNQNSSVVSILQKTQAGVCISFQNEEKPEQLGTKIYETMNRFISRLPFEPETNWKEFEPYTAREASKKQAAFFDKIVSEV